MLLLMSVVESLETEEQKETAEQIFIKYKNAMFKYANSILKNKHDAEEAVGNTIIKICKNIDDFISIPENEKKLLVKKYTKWTAIDMYRKKHNDKTELFGDEDYLESENINRISTVEKQVIFSGEEFGYLQKYVLKLSEKYQTILTLKYVHGYTNKKIAALLNMPESTVSTQLVRARTLLMNIIQEEKEKKNGSDKKR